MARKRGKEKETANVEFGLEFGDLNAAKNFETPFVNQGSKKQERNK